MAVVTTARAVLLCCVLSTQPGCGARSKQGTKTRVIILGFDGMDDGLTRQMLSEGRLPNFSRLAATGSFQPLGTSMPPQSPVAWSSFITGMDAGGHGIFDFIHRDPRTLLPFLSTSRTVPGDTKVTVGRWQIPLAADRVELLRRGRPFWEALERRGIETTIVRMPANFPPSGLASRELSGMGTPDALGSYGTFSYYTSSTSEAAAFAGREVSGGNVYPVDVESGVVRSTLAGPRNPFFVDGRRASIDFAFRLDPDRPAGRLTVGDEERLLMAGEWSDWVPIPLKLFPTRTIDVMARFYLKGARPDFQLYVTPLDFDPMNPAMPIATPAAFARELAEATGRFYTQGMPEDTKAYKEGIFTPEEFLAQARLAQAEVAAQYRFVLDQFGGGLLFYYFGDGDQVSHMMWRAMDPGHPAYRPSDARFHDAVRDIYEGFDRIVGETLAGMGDGATLIVMSDHGFTSWRRAFHLNAWLADNGYLATREPRTGADPGLLSNVDWSRTRAYALGLNGLYLNLAGRERAGIVEPAARDALAREIANKLLATRDPKTGQPAVTRAFRSEEYRDRGSLEIGPDLIIGYARGTRSSNESALGQIGPDVITDNTDAWSGDHCMDPATVPGVLFTSRPLKKQAARLEDLAAAILAEFGVEDFPAPR